MIEKFNKIMKNLYARQDHLEMLIMQNTTWEVGNLTYAENDIDPKKSLK